MRLLLLSALLALVVLAGCTAEDGLPGSITGDPDAVATGAAPAAPPGEEVWGDVGDLGILRVPPFAGDPGIVRSGPDTFAGDPGIHRGAPLD